MALLFIIAAGAEHSNALFGADGFTYFPAPLLPGSSAATSNLTTVAKLANRLTDSAGIAPRVGKKCVSRGLYC